MIAIGGQVQGLYSFFKLEEICKESDPKSSAIQNPIDGQHAKKQEQI